jgi:hypothetical protein
MKEYRVMGREMTEKEYLKVLDYITTNYPYSAWNEKPAHERGIIINKILSESRKKLKEVM